MLTVPAPLQAHYESGGTTLARLWKAVRKDGAIFGFTDHDQELLFGGVRYEPSSVFDRSAIDTKLESAVDNLELQGLFDSAGISAAEIEAGLWDGAEFELREVNWANLAQGAKVLRYGELGQVQRRTGQYVAEMRGLKQKLQNSIGRTVTPACDAELGDARCKVNVEALSGTVTAVSSRRAFQANALFAVAGYFSFGVVKFTGGLNIGLSMEIRKHEGLAGSPAGAGLSLQLNLPYAIAVGDTFTIVPGCDKSKATCKNRFNNLLNFRGFSFVPGSDQVLLVGGQ